MSKGKPIAIAPALAAAARAVSSGRASVALALRELGLHVASTAAVLCDRKWSEAERANVVRVLLGGLAAAPDEVLARLPVNVLARAALVLPGSGAQHVVREVTDAGVGRELARFDDSRSAHVWASMNLQGSWTIRPELDVTSRRTRLSLGRVRHFPARSY